MMARAATAEQAMEAIKPHEGPEYMRIDEEQVENHCNHGYEFVQVLPSGKVLIRRKKD
jgi:transketolase C-terminal domain/subunit